MTGQRIAAFDFDGTLTKRDTVLPFLVRACGARAVSRVAARVAPTGIRGRLGRLENGLHHRDVVKEALLRELLAGREASWLAERGADYAETLPGRLRPAMVSQAQWHREQGHQLVIVSASLHAYLDPFAMKHGFHHVIAVGLATDAAGILTGALTGPNVRGPEKAVRLGAWLDGKPPEFLWAYGNSSGDSELLAMADHPVWVAGPNCVA
ncbi:MAG: HAD-IB family hydrolase [Aquihabitans sp.]